MQIAQKLLTKSLGNFMEWLDIIQGIDSEKGQCH